MNSREEDNLIFVVLSNGEDFFSSIKDVSIKHNIVNGIIISALGQIKKFKLGFYKNKNYIIRNFEKPYEIVNFAGNIIKNLEDDYELHIHAVLSDENMNTIGGHFINGKVELISEFIIIKTNFQISRIFDKSTNTKRIVF